MPRKKTITGKKHKGFYIYSRDLLSSQRYRRCSWATKGVYLDLLNVLAVQDHPGALCLRDYDLKPHGERSLTQRCLACQKKAKNGEYQSIKYFAEAVAVSVSGPRPGLIHGLQELYMRGIIVINSDTLLQPRMYRDSGMIVTDFEGQPIDVGEGEYITVVGSPDDAESDPDAEKLRLGELADNNINNDVDNKVQKCTEKSTKKARVGARDARAHSKRVRVRDINNINNNDNKEEIEKEKTKNRILPKKTKIPFNEFWDAYDKKVEKPKSETLWNKLSQADRVAVMAYIPRYKESQPEKRYRKNPTTFLRNRSWEDEIIPHDGISASHNHKKGAVQVDDNNPDRYSGDEW